MRHCDDETLSLLALGEPADPEVSSHVSGCPRCSGKLHELKAVVDGVRAPVPPIDDVVPVAPPSHVWEAIAAATGVRATPAPTVTGTAGPVEGTAATAPGSAPPVPRPSLTPVPGGDRARSGDRGTDRATDRAGHRSGDGHGEPQWRPTVARRGRRRAALLAVAASSLALGVAGGVLGTLLLRPPAEPPQPQRTPIAATQLSPLPDAPSASGRAEVVQTADGWELDVDVARLGAPKGFYQVWLIDPTVTKMVPVGVLRGQHGRFDLPTGVTLKDYPVIDISVEPIDGNPAHSGKSVLRGTVRS